MIDEELLNAFLLATQGNKNVSGTLGNLDNPLLLFLAGQYNPLTSMGVGRSGGVGPIGSRYAGNESYPAVNEILNEIATGADQFQVATKAKALIAKGQIDGLESGEFEKLANALYKETKGEGSDKSWLQRPALADPTDIYSMDNLPNRPGLNAFLRQFNERQVSQIGKLESASKDVESRRKNVSPLFDKEFTTRDLATYLRTDPEGSKLAKERGVDFSKLADDGTLYSTPGTGRPKRAFYDPRGLVETFTTGPIRAGVDIVETVKEAARGDIGKRPKRAFYDPRGLAEFFGAATTRNPSKNLSNKVGGTGKIVAGKEKEKQQYREATSKVKQIQDEMTLDAYQAEKFKKAYLGRLAERGINPLDDQLKGVMSFLSQNR